MIIPQQSSWTCQPRRSPGTFSSQSEPWRSCRS